MGARGPLPSPLRQYVVGLYTRGELATLQEGSLIAAVSRVRVLEWLQAAGIDWQRQRQVYVAKHRRKAVLVSEGKSVRRPSKRELRAQAARAKAQWDKAHGRDCETADQA